MSTSGSTKLTDLLAAFATGGLLTLMVHFNGELARHGNVLFASWTAHATGTVFALAVILFLRSKWKAAHAGAGKVPWWAYLSGVSGAVTVMLTAYTVNSSLALSGTLALGLGGQVAFSLAADRWGLFGLPRRLPDLRDIAALVLVLAGSAIIIFFGLG